MKQEITNRLLTVAQATISNAEKELGPLVDGQCRDLLLDTGVCNIWPDAKRVVDILRHSRKGRRMIAKKNPVKKSRRISRANLTDTAYIYRPSQITKKKPVKRLVKRRVKNLKAPKGVFPNPVKAKPKKSNCFVLTIDDKFIADVATLPLAKELAVIIANREKKSVKIVPGYSPIYK